MAFDHLLSPLRLGDIECRNRIVMAPCTRCMSPGAVPNDAVARYYERRAADGVGLLISEGTVITPRGNGYPDVPGIHDEAQVEAWRRVTARVHDAGGRIACQIWHVGAVAHPRTTGGPLPEGPSGISPEGEIRRLREPDGSFVRYGTSEAMSEARIVEVIDLYRRAAVNALRAGFDAVEIHGAHGYLIDQFTNLHFNRRTDGWGGAARCRFAGEVTRAVVAEIGAGRTLFRFSPAMSVARRGWPDPEITFGLLLDTLRAAGLRIVHASHGRYDEPVLPLAAVPGDRRSDLRPDDEGRVTVHAGTRAVWPGQLVGVGDLTPERAEQAIADGEIDAAAFGRALIANPDFVSRLREGRALRAYDPGMLDDLDGERPPLVPPPTETS